MVCRGGRHKFQGLDRCYPWGALTCLHWRKEVFQRCCDVCLYYWIFKYDILVYIGHVPMMIHVIQIFRSCLSLLNACGTSCDGEQHEVVRLVSPFCRFLVSKHDLACHYMRMRMICRGMSLNLYILKTWLPKYCNITIRSNSVCTCMQYSDLFTFYLHKFSRGKEKRHVRKRTMARSRARRGQGSGMFWCRGRFLVITMIPLVHFLQWSYVILL